MTTETTDTMAVTWAQAKCKGPKPRDKCNGQVVMEVKWKAATSKKDAKATFYIEKWKYLVDWVMLSKAASKPRQQKRKRAA